MLEIRKNPFTKSYENEFFRRFAKTLSEIFRQKNWDGLLLGSPKCLSDNRLQIDALLITNNVICIIDFKNHQGRISFVGSDRFENCLWQNEIGEIIKGGSHRNPFLQLKHQKTSFYKVCEEYIVPKIGFDKLNPAHTVSIVIFQNSVELQQPVPAHLALSFYILDADNFSEKILDILDVADPQVQISTSDFDIFKSIFVANEYSIDSTEEPFTEPAYLALSKSQDDLTESHKNALASITQFLIDDQNQLFILFGSYQSGKTSLLPYIQELAFKNGFDQVVYLAPSHRIIRNTPDLAFQEFESIYSYLYSTKEVEEAYEDYPLEVASNVTKEDEIKIGCVPLRTNLDSEKTLYIVEAAHLIFDEYYEFIDKVYGSGKLLHDLIEFCDLHNSKRKIIFVSDPYLLVRGNHEHSAINKQYLENFYHIRCSDYHLADNVASLGIVREALKCVAGLRAGMFNTLVFRENLDLEIIHKDGWVDHLRELISHSQKSVFLTFKNENANRVNLWIKREILRNGDELAKGDLVLLENSLKWSDSVFLHTAYGGDYFIVEKVSPRIIEQEIKVKEQTVTLKFREITLSSAYGQLDVLALENYLLSEKNDLLKEEKIAYRILLSKLLNQQLKNKPFDNSEELQPIRVTELYKRVNQEDPDFVSRVIQDGRTGVTNEEQKKLKKLINEARKKHKKRVEAELLFDPESEYFRYRNVALLRYGWAITVHKALAYKFPEIILDCDWDFGPRTNEYYFRYLYSGMTRALNKVYLYNYEPITPFSFMSFCENIVSNHKRNVIFFVSENSERSSIEQFRLFLENKLGEAGFRVEKFEGKPWLEICHIFINGQRPVLYVTYDKKGQFWIQNIKAEDEIKHMLTNLLVQKKESLSFDQVNENWRWDSYKRLSQCLWEKAVKIKEIEPQYYRDRLNCFRNDDELVVDMIYTAKGEFTVAEARYFSTPAIWNDFKDSISTIAKTYE